MRFVVLVALLAWPCGAAAQDAEEPAESTEAPDAREAFRLGSEAAAEERWADSERLFRIAYEGSNVPAALFNRAVALRALGRHREARDAFAELLELEISDEVRGTATEMHAESVERVGRLTIAGLEAEAHVVRLDGESVPDDGGRPFAIEADAGRHTLIVERSGYEPFHWSGDVTGGSSVEVPVALVAVPVNTVVREVPVEREPSVVEDPLFWVLLLGGVAIAGAAIGVGVGFDQAQLRPEAMVRFEL